MEFIFDRAPYPSCHASTIVQSDSGTLMAAWFGGTRERAPDVAIWVSRCLQGHWSEAVKVAVADDGAGHPLPTWNPVLFQPRGRPLMLFYKAGPSPQTWWGMVMTSRDEGISWSAPSRLPDRILGPIKNKPIELANGNWLCPSSDESHGWKIDIERSDDSGRTWNPTPWLNDGEHTKLIQPTLLDHGHGRLQLLCRSQGGKIYQSWSDDSGMNWQPPSPTELPNPNSGIDAVQMKDGRSLLIYNPSENTRHPISFAISSDGRSWSAPVEIENTDGPELSYPAVIQSQDGLIHLTYTWKRQRIRHVILDPALIGR